MPILPHHVTTARLPRRSVGLGSCGCIFENENYIHLNIRLLQSSCRNPYILSAHTFYNKESNVHFIFWPSGIRPLTHLDHFRSLEAHT